MCVAGFTTAQDFFLFVLVLVVGKSIPLHQFGTLCVSCLHETCAFHIERLMT